MTLPKETPEIIDANWRLTIATEEARFCKRQLEATFAAFLAKPESIEYLCHHKAVIAYEKAVKCLKLEAQKVRELVGFTPEVKL